MASRSAQFSLSFFSLDSLSSWSALKVLNLSGNHLKSLTRGSQQSIRLTRLKVLDLSHNNLQVIHQKGEVSVSDDKLQEFSFIKQTNFVNISFKKLQGGRERGRLFTPENLNSLKTTLQNFVAK